MTNEQLAALDAVATQVQRHADKADFIASEIARYGYSNPRRIAEGHARELRDTLTELRAGNLVVRTEPSGDRWAIRDELEAHMAGDLPSVDPDNGHLLPHDLCHSIMLELGRMPSEADVEWVVSDIIRDVCELPDYTSPDDQPDLLQCTVEELTLIVTRSVEDAIAAMGGRKLQERVDDLERELQSWQDAAQHD